MKAVVCERYGSPDVLQLKEVEKPLPKDNEVLIKIHATTVNRTDTATLRAKPFFMRFVTGMFKPKKNILGSDFAGIVEAIGKNVSSFKTGDRVFGFNEDSFGSHAQYMIIAENKALITIPDNTTYEEAVACIEGAFYSYNFINKVNIERGQKVLVNGATGAIGSATVQLLKYYGANVTAVCAGENMELVQSLGANRVIDYEKEDFTKDKEEYNCVFDTVGKSSFFECKKILVNGGVYISSDLGFMWQNIMLPIITPIIKPMIENKKTIFPNPLDCKGFLLVIKKIIEEGNFKAVIDRRYPLKEIVEAYKYVEKGHKVGNVVITVEHVVT